jgi:uncharacterized protein (DUF2384 family)
MSKDNKLISDNMAALQARFQAQSRKAQAYYAVMHEATRVLGSDAAASRWMEAPLAAFEGKTPAVLVGDGRENALLEHIRSLTPGKP